MSAAINLDGALAVFFVESRDLLAGMEQGLQALAGQSDAREQLNAIFRAAHTIKGSAGIFGLADIVHFTHAVETFLTQARDGGLALEAPALATLLDCHDHLNDLIDKAEGGETVDDAARAAGEALIGALSRLSGGTPQPAGHGGAPSGRADATHEADARRAREATGAGSPPDAADAAGDTVAAATWHISVRFAPAVLRTAWTRPASSATSARSANWCTSSACPTRCRTPRRWTRATAISVSRSTWTPTRTSGRSRTPSSSCATTAGCTFCRRTAASPTTSP